MSTIRCFCSCGQCGIDKQMINVPERQDQQDVIVWLNETARIMGRDHATRSPHCTATTLDIGIPHGGEDTLVGKKPLS